MSEETTTYVVETRYVLDDKASEALKGIAGHAARGEQHVESLSGALRHLGHALMVGEGLRLGKEMFIDFNSELEQMKISMAAIMEMNLGGSFKRNQAVSEDLFKEFQRFSKLTPVTTKEVMSFGTGVSAAVFGAGGSMKDFIKITEQGVIASKVFGANAEYAALEIQELLMGNVSKRMRFAMQLLHAAGVDEKTFKAMTASQRIATVEKVLDSDAMKKAADAFSNSFAGVTSTLKDNLEITLGQIGLPLFKAVTKEIRGWNHWIEQNPQKIEAFAKRFSDALVSGFHTLQQIGAWVVQHADMLETIAKLYLGMKIGGAVQNVFSGLASAASGLAGNMTSLGGALGVLIPAVLMLADAYGKEEARRIGSQFDAAGSARFARANDRVGDKALINEARDKGAITGTGADARLNVSALARSFDLERTAERARVLAFVGDKAQAEQAKVTLARSVIAMMGTITAFHRMNVASDTFSQMLARGGKGLSDLINGGLGKLNDMLGGIDFGQHPNLKQGDVNVKIEHLEVASDDPDRFIVGLGEAARKAKRNPAQARETLRGFGG